MFYILDGRTPVPATAAEFEAYYFDEGFRRFILRETCGRFLVSTIFLGIDHGMGSKPVLFETMVFDQSAADQWAAVALRRYATMDEAEAGHKRLCKVFTRVGRKK